MTRKTTRERLALAAGTLRELDVARADWRDEDYGRSAEEWIVWRELLDLELQNVDEQIDRICACAGESPA